MPNPDRDREAGKGRSKSHDEPPAWPHSSIGLEATTGLPGLVACKPLCWRSVNHLGPPKGVGAAEGLGLRERPLVPAEAGGRTERVNTGGGERGGGRGRGLLAGDDAGLDVQLLGNGRQDRTIALGV